jgi:hypothetical protein
MENQQQTGSTPEKSEAFFKKRKFYLFIPLIVLPFLTMAFWALGGGKDGGSAKLHEQRGIDLALPSAQFKDNKPKDKLDIYQSAGKDSSITSEGVNKSFVEAMGFNPDDDSPNDSPNLALAGNSPANNEADHQSAKIEAKLAQLNRQLNEPQSASYAKEAADPEVKRLHRMMKSMRSTGDDPEMKQLSNMLTKIQAIQNPESVKTETRKSKDEENAFRAIPAVIDGKQKVVNGGTVRLKLSDSVKLKGVQLPKGQLIFGACQITNQRLLLTIQNIRVGKTILPTDLTVFSLDGMPGIPAPEAELSGAAGTGADNAIASMQFLSMDQTLGAQAAASGINAAKGLFSKKVKKIKVKLQDNFAVLLRDNSRKK